MPRHIEESGGTTRVRLRPSGCANFVAVPFLAFWLCGWAVGEVAVLTILVRSFGIDFTFPLPGAIGKLLPHGDPQISGAPIVFMFVWLTFWTFGGLAAMTTLLRQIGGADVIELRPDEWNSWRGILMFGRERVFHIGDAGSIYTRRKDNALVALVSGKEVLITNLGTATERAWLRDQIAARYSVALPENRIAALQTAEGEIVLPPQWTSEPLADGSTEVSASAQQRRGLRGCLAIFTGILEGIIALPALIHFVTHTASAADYVRALFAVAILAGAFALWNAKERWSVREGILTHDLAIGPYRKSERFTGGVFSVTSTRDSDDDESFVLELAPSDAPKRRLYSGSDQTAVIGFARFLAAKTGWRLEVPEAVLAP
jgi:hypothetical protein